MINPSKWRQIQDLDLTREKTRLRNRRGWWWNRRHDVDRLEREYRRFLYLIAENPGRVIVSWTEAVDDFWHEHILDTRKYDADCQAIFGRLVHHNPHLTKGSPPQRQAFLDTKVLYRTTFGAPVPQRRSRTVRSGGGDDTSTLFWDSGDSCSDHSGHHDGGSSCGASCGASCGGGGD